MKTHTPAPWIAKKSIHGGQYKYVQIGADEAYTTLEVLPEDARLIAAAPELLDALKRAAEYAPNEVEYQHALKVIAKAEGKHGS